MLNLVTKCDHLSRSNEFKDLHRGGGGEVYLRAYVSCNDCDWKTCVAIRLPDVMTNVLDENLSIGTLTRHNIFNN